MATDPPPPRTTPPRTPSRAPPKRSPPPVITPPSELARYLPYAAVLAVAGVLVLTILRSERYNIHAAALLGLCVLAGLGYVGWQHVHGLSPDDRFRRAVTAVTGVVLAGALAPYLFSLYPPAIQGSVRLQRQGDEAAVEIRGAAASVVLIASGEFKNDLGPSARANYALEVTHDGTREEVEGTFQRMTTESSIRRGVHGGGSTTELKAVRHVLHTIHGAGRYTVALAHLPETLQPPVVVAASAEPFSPLVLGVLFGLLALAVLAVDVGLSRRNMESAYAAALLVPLVAVFYFHGHMTRETLPNDLLAAAIVGVLGGGLGGELLARITRSVAGR